MSRSKQDRSAAEPPPSKLRVVLMFPICLVLAAGLFWLGGTEGVIMAVLLVLSYVVLVFFTLVSDSPTKIFSLTTSIPVGSQGEDGKKLLRSIISDPEHAEESLKRHLAEHAIVPDSGLWRTLDALTGGRLKQSLADAGKTATVERTPEGFAMRSDVRLDLDPAGDRDMLETLVSAISGKAASQAPKPVDEDEPQTAESFLAQGDDLRKRGIDKEAREVYEKAQAHALVDWANGQTRDRGLLPTVLMRLGKLDAARALLSEALAATPNDEKLLAAQALLDEETG